VVIRFRFSSASLEVNLARVPDLFGSVMKYNIVMKN